MKSVPSGKCSSRLGTRMLLPRRYARVALGDVRKRLQARHAQQGTHEPNANTVKPPSALNALSAEQQVALANLMNPGRTSHALAQTRQATGYWQTASLRLQAGPGLVVILLPTPARGNPKAPYVPGMPRHRPW